MKSVKSILPVGMLALGLMCALPVLSSAEMMEDKGMMKDSATAMKDTMAEPAIGGFCPIALHEGHAMKGSSDFVTTYEGKKYMFVNAQAQKMFLENPEEYTKDAEMKFQAIMKK